MILGILYHFPFTTLSKLSKKKDSSFRRNENFEISFFLCIIDYKYFETEENLSIKMVSDSLSFTNFPFFRGDKEGF